MTVRRDREGVVAGCQHSTGVTRECQWWRLERIGGSLPGGSSIGLSDGGVEDSRLGSGAWLQQICRSGHDLRESASASVRVVLGSGCCVWWPIEGSSVNCACVFAACGERQRP